MCIRAFQDVSRVTSFTAGDIADPSLPGRALSKNWDKNKNGIKGMVENSISWDPFRFKSLNIPQKNKRIILTLGRTRVKCVVPALHPTPRICLQFFQEDFLTAPAIFNSCTSNVAVHAYHIRHILAKWGENRLVGVWLILRHKYQVVKPFLNEKACFFHLFCGKKYVDKKV